MKKLLLNSLIGIGAFIVTYSIITFFKFQFSLEGAIYFIIGMVILFFPFILFKKWADS